MRNTIVAVATATLLTSVTSAHAVLTLGGPAPLSNLAGTDNPDTEFDSTRIPSVTGDGRGNWVAVWEGVERRDLFGHDSEIYVVTSSDNGNSWTTPLTVNNDAATDTITDGGDSSPLIVTDRGGTWVVVWRRGLPRTARSVDNGNTWSTPVLVDGAFGHCSLATDGGAVWLVASDSGSGQALLSRSTDDGQSWSAVPGFASGDPTNFYDDRNPALATDGNGNWVVIWLRGLAVVASSSSDNGLTWTSPTQVGLVGIWNSLTQQLATDGNGRWVAIWETLPSWSVELTFAVSTDNGATWTPQRFLLPNALEQGNDLDASLEVSSDGTFYVGFFHEHGGLSGKDPDVFFARSVDGGMNWTTPAAINLLGGSDGAAEDYSQRLGYDGAKDWVAVWTSTNDLGGTIGTDRDVLFARGRDDCPPQPADDCAVPTQPGRSRLTMRDGRMDKYSWQWAAGEETTRVDLGDPTGASSYVACLYAEIEGTRRAIFEADATGGATCGAAPCWTATATGFVYRDPEGRNGAVRSLSLAAGPAGAARIQLRANGLALGVPRLPLPQTSAVLAQLINTENGKCWEAEFSTPTLNDGARYKAASE
ncbi:MAG TPA: sialidase family protein [Candidatus Binatia bacterium]|nr:sialidase family protein [Candidatus Binatia bacterium]